jgi:hypothetical protein
MRMLAILSAATLALLGPASQVGAEVQLSIQDGRVKLVAKDATVREILAEWARVGQTKIVNAERIPGGPVTLELTDISERQALDVLLRTISGYVAATRTTPVARASMFDRIIVMPTTVAAPSAASAAPPAFAQPTFAQPTFAQAPQAPDDSDDDRPPTPGGVGPQNRPPVFVFPSPQTTNPQQIPPLATPNGGFIPQPAQTVPVQNVPSATLPPTAPYPGAPTTTVVPGGVAVPGMVAQPPAPPPGQQPFVVPPPQQQQQR